MGHLLAPQQLLYPEMGRDFNIANRSSGGSLGCILTGINYATRHAVPQGEAALVKKVEC